MTHLLYKHFALLMLAFAAIITAGCSSNDMDDPTISTAGDDFITSFTINGQQGEIDNKAKTVSLWLEPGTDLTALKPVFTLSDGAKCNIESGSAVDFTMPVVFKITNGNTYIDYTVTVRTFDAQLLTLTLTDAAGNKYDASIDQAARTAEAYVSENTDLTRLYLSYTLSEGASADITEGTAADLSRPLTITISSHGLTAAYTVTAVQTDMPVTAFIGTAATVDGLKDEERAAARWMLDNVPRSVYISMQDLISGKQQLDPEVCKAVWWHCDDPSWPSQAWDSREAIKQYYAKGGSLLLSRYACRYVNDVYQIAVDQKQPNAESKNDAAVMTDSDLGFIVDRADHRLFSGMSAVKDRPIMLISAGMKTTNCCVCWNIYDYPGHSLEGWQTATGGTRLAYQPDDSNKTAIVEFAPRSKQAGRVLLIGTGGYEWNIAGDGQNSYASNRKQLTLNALRYLCGMDE